MISGENGDQLSSFKTLINEHGIRVVKTKIINRVDSYQFRCPILLDGKNDIVRLLVRETHENSGHAGVLTIMNILRERFWVTSLRKIIRSIISKCVVCKKQHAKHLECEPAPLPLNRVRDAAVFEVVGLDFAGPLFTKGGGKTWICIFRCAVYRAVHFELASSLSVEGFLECFRRFVARRGRPRDVYSDNGTNFVGSNNAFGKLEWQKIANQSALSRIEWHFSPPSAPWWGGWWKRLIGVMKRILRKTLGKASLSYEGLYTALCDAEAIINARPLTYISENPEELVPLSPSFFLQEVREVGIVDCDMLYHSKLNKKAKYRLKILKDLRVRFRAEYLGQLTIKKGKGETRKIKPGDIVLIGDDLHKRLDWPLARVVEIYPGCDGNTRVALLKTKEGLKKRAFQRIFPLEIPQDDAKGIEELCKKANYTSEQSMNEKDDKCISKNLNEGENDKNENCISRNINEEENNRESELCERDSAVIVTKSGRRVRKPDYFKY
ncbi:uncharacterized protein LOC122507568 [Leptopilina heterotoma]|uniref:uncharacterized protein LOC122507568 n=1 Tax=Leptopilina heterotoma TaxID=63436 RepID=UPI001CA984FA|nr:uncharacterized protein LOC122507568 [Leptopilina heterotoma]